MAFLNIDDKLRMDNNKQQQRNPIDNTGKYSTKQKEVGSCSIDTPSKFPREPHRAREALIQSIVAWRTVKESLDHTQPATACIPCMIKFLMTEIPLGTIS